MAFATTSQAAPNCADWPDAGKPRIELSTTIAEPVIRRGMPDVEPETDASAPRQVGLTTAKRNASYQFTIAFQRRDGRPGVCFRLNDLAVRLALSEIDVYIAARYRPGSCPYRVALAHERKHVAIHKRLFRARATRLGRDLRRQARGPARWAETEAAAREILTSELGRTIDRHLKAFKLALARANAPLDTAKNYDRESRRCPAKDW